MLFFFFLTSLWTGESFTELCLPTSGKHRGRYSNRNEPSVRRELGRKAGAVCTDLQRCVFVLLFLLAVFQSEKTIWREQLGKAVGCIDLSQFMLLSQRSRETCLIAISVLLVPISANNISSGWIKRRGRRRQHSSSDVLGTSSGFLSLSAALGWTLMMTRQQNELGLWDLKWILFSRAEALA